MDIINGFEQENGLRMLKATGLRFFYSQICLFSHSLTSNLLPSQDWTLANLIVRDESKLRYPTSKHSHRRPC